MNHRFVVMHFGGFNQIRVWAVAPSCQKANGEKECGSWVLRIRGLGLDVQF